MNDFEQQKQGIIDFIKDGCDQQLMNQTQWEATIIKEVKQLQPPKPPTCSTCDYYQQVSMEVKLNSNQSAVHPHQTCTNEKMLKSLRIRYSIASNLYIEPTPDYGCTHHSDYEVTK